MRDRLTTLTLLAALLALPAAASAQTTYTVDDTIAYDFQDISGSGTAILLGDDEVSGAIPLGFSFDYFGSPYSDVYVSSNGFLTVLPGQSNGCCIGLPIPTPGDPDGVIAGWWEDLFPPGAGTIQYQTLGTTPNQIFIVQFTGVAHCCGSADPVTMQFKLFETTNVIEVHYQAAPGDSSEPDDHSAGLENADGSAGVQYYLGTPSLPTPLAVRYSPAVTQSVVEIPTLSVAGLAGLAALLGVAALGLLRSRRRNA